MTDRAIRSVCVAGGGVVAHSAALAFARALPRVRVSLLETPANEGTLADRLPASLPAVHRFNAAIGMGELDLVRDGAATHLLGTRFEAWSASGEPWLHVFGEYGLSAGNAPFHGVWQRARQAGRALPFHRYAAAAAFAEAGKFAHPTADPRSPLGSYLYALRLDPDRYLDRLRTESASLPRESGEIAGVEPRSDGGVAALLLAGGRRVEADLYLDCTGPSAAILSRIDDRFEDWGEWLPCDRVTITAEAKRPPTACDVVTATASGWRWQSPLEDRTLAITATASAFGEKSGEGFPIRAGRRPEPWRRNVLAIGDSSLALDPLYGGGLHLAQSAILLALELLPGRDCHPLELREYVRRFDQQVIRVRDFVALHYLRSGRADTPFWLEMASRAPPESLGRTLEQFERRGRLPFFEEESFERHSWLGALLGLGVDPRQVDTAAAGVDLGRAAAAMDSLAARLAALPDRFPPYVDLLARMKIAPAGRSPAIRDSGRTLAAVTAANPFSGRTS